MNLNHIHLHVASVDRAAAFYERYFGLRRQVWHGDILFMRDQAGMDLALAPAEAVEPFPPWFHIGFRLDAPGEVEALHERLRADGAPILQPYAVDGDFAVFRCADPDGYQLEIYFEPDP